MATKKTIAKAKKAVAKPAKKQPSNKKPAVTLKKAAKPAVKTVKKAAVKKAAPAAKKVVVNQIKAKTAPAAKKAVVAKPVSRPAVKTPVAKTPAVKVPAVKTPVAKVPAAKPVKSAKPAIVPAAIAKPIQPSKATIPPPESKANIPKTIIMTEKNNGSEKSRYSDTELKEFKELIIGKLHDARNELINLNAAIISANENGTDDTGASFKMLEDGSDTLAKEEAAQLAARQKKFIEQLEAALVRIENKTYGVCRVTGKLIPKERLRAVPHTTQSMEAKMQQYKD
jgi:RNA polymerase-binding transcription factor DksA